MNQSKLTEIRFVVNQCDLLNNNLSKKMILKMMESSIYQVCILRGSTCKCFGNKVVLIFDFMMGSALNSVG